MARRLTNHNPDEIPSCVVIGVPDKAALFRVIEKLRRYDIGHQVFYEPDFNMGLSAVATVPIEGQQRRALSNYHIWQASEQADSAVPTQANSAVPPQVNSVQQGVTL
jgi:hypothetical protein